MRSLKISNVHGAISKLRKLTNCAEHMMMYTYNVAVAYPEKWLSFYIFSVSFAGSQSLLWITPQELEKWENRTRNIRLLNGRAKGVHE